MQSDDVNLRQFKLRLFNITEFIVYCLKYYRSMTSGLKDIGIKIFDFVGKKLISFIIKRKKRKQVHCLMVFTVVHHLRLK